MSTSISYKGAKGIVIRRISGFWMIFLTMLSKVHLMLCQGQTEWKAFSFAFLAWAKQLVHFAKKLDSIQRVNPKTFQKRVF